MTILTGWQSTCSTLTVSSTNGWWTNFDNIVIDNGQGTVISAVQAGGQTANGATITWSTNVTATSQVEYGPINTYGSTTPPDSTLVLNHSVALGSLSSGTLYHDRVRSNDSAGNPSMSGDFTFMTTSGACNPPITNPVACENSLPGAPSSQWDIATHDQGDNTIQGYATDISYAPGTTVNFKINTPASAYTITIYRVGY